jgi:predicted membrane metal-binding protein
MLLHNLLPKSAFQLLLLLLLLLLPPHCFLTVAVACFLQEDVVERVPFLLMGLELPPTPLFKDALEKNIIPQVSACRRSFV